MSRGPPESTEIYQGLKVIDQKLGGTTTLDVVLNFEDDEEPEEVSEEPANPDADEEESEEFEDFSEFEEEIEAEEGGAQYWFTNYRMEQLEALHNYLDEIPETGKVLSLATLLKVGRTINDGKPLDNFMLALVYNELPEEFRKFVEAKRQAADLSSRGRAEMLAPAFFQEFLEATSTMRRTS